MTPEEQAAWEEYQAYEQYRNSQPAPQEPSYAADLMETPKSFVKGATNLVSAGAILNPMNIAESVGRAGAAYVQGEDPWKAATQTQAFQTAGMLERGRQELVGDPTYTTTAGRYTGAVAEQLPGVAIPGGPLAGRVASAVGAGIGGQLASDTGLPEVAGQIVGGALPGVAGAAARGFGAAATSTGEAAERGVIGYNIARKAKAVGAVDEAGNVVDSMQDATKLVSKKDLMYKDLEDVGFFKQLAGDESPEKAAVKLAQLEENSGKTIGTLIDDAEVAENAVLSNPNLAPWQKQEYLASSSPTFEAARSYIDDLKSTGSEQIAKRLERKLDSVAQAWEKSDKTVTTLKQFQEKFGSINNKSFNPNSSSLQDSAENTINKLLYSDLAGSVQGRLTTLNPRLGEQLSTANKAYAAAATFKNDAFNASRQSAPPDQTIWRSVGKGLRDWRPMTTARVGKTLGGISTAVGQSAPISSMTPGTINAISDAASAVIPQDAPTTLDMIVNARQLPPPTMPRDWDLVKSDPELMNELANRAEALGIIPAMQFGMMSEPMKKQLHTAVIQAAPQFAEQIPGGYNVINNQYMNPMERDAAISSVMDKPAAERARVAGAALTNKFQAPSNTSSIGAQPKFALPATIDKLNSSLDSVLQPRIDTPLDTSYDNSSSSMMDELDRAIMLHGVN